MTETIWLIVSLVAGIISIGVALGYYAWVNRQDPGTERAKKVAAWIRQGQQIKVVDNKTSEDVTSQTLTQIISEEGRKGTTVLPKELLHELIRIGEEAVSSGVEQIQNRMDRLVQASIDRIGPVRRAREEMGRLRERLDELEASLSDLETERRRGPEPKSGDSA